MDEGILIFVELLTINGRTYKNITIFEGRAKNRNCSKKPDQGYESKIVLLSFLQIYMHKKCRLFAEVRYTNALFVYFILKFKTS